MPVAALAAVVLTAVLVTTARAECAGDCPPQRIVSMNLCADVLLLALADRRRIASVSFLAVDPTYSPVVDEARGLPLNQGLAEEVLALEADLVLAGLYTNRSSVALLRRLGVRIVELDVPRSLDQTRAQIRMLAEALHVPDAGESLIAAMDERLAALAAAGGGARPLGALFHPNGFTTGRGTLTHELMERAGMDNLAARDGLDGWGYLALEDLILGRPDLVILAAGGEQAPSLARMLTRHPAIRALPDLEVVTIPEAQWTCAGPWVLDAIERLVQARRSWQRMQEDRSIGR